MKNVAFFKSGLEIIRTQGEVLIMVRYHAQAGNRDFFFINSEIGLQSFLHDRKPKESITLFDSFESLAKGFVNDTFITKYSRELDQPRHTDWLVLLIKFTGEVKGWHYDETKEELLESLNLYTGKYIRIIEDPLCLNEDQMFHTSVPDKDGIVRPGVY